VRLLPEQVLDPEHVLDREVPVLASQLLGQRLPAEEALAVDVRHVAQLERQRRLTELRRQLGREQDQRRHGRALGGLEDEQPAHPVADGNRGGPEPLQGRHDVVRVALEGQLGGVARR
jgi:hypothetical protein